MRLFDLAVAFTIALCVAALITVAVNGAFPSRAGAPPPPPAPSFTATPVHSSPYVWVLHDTVTGQDYLLSERYITPRLPATAAEMKLCPTP